MIIPIRCHSCGAVIADKWLYYQKKVEEMKQSNEKKEIHKSFDEIQTKKIFEELEMRRYCCPRMFLGHVDLIDEI